MITRRKTYLRASLFTFILIELTLNFNRMPAAGTATAYLSQQPHSAGLRRKFPIINSLIASCPLQRPLISTRKGEFGTPYDAFPMGTRNLPNQRGNI